MRYIRYLILAILIVLLVSFTMGNMQPVTVNLMTERLSSLVGFNYSLTLPLFLVLMGGVAVGLVLGYLFEWIREHKHRREATTKAREARRLERQVEKLKKEKHKDNDEILAILEEAS